MFTQTLKNPGNRYTEPLRASVNVQALGRRVYLYRFQAAWEWTFSTSRNIAHQHLPQLGSDPTGSYPGSCVGMDEVIRDARELYSEGLGTRDLCGGRLARSALIHQEETGYFVITIHHAMYGA